MSVSPWREAEGLPESHDLMGCFDGFNELTRCEGIDPVGDDGEEDAVLIPRPCDEIGNSSDQDLFIGNGEPFGRLGTG